MATLARNGGQFTPNDIAVPMAIATDPTTCAAIKLNDSLNLGLGEWFIDTQQGIPYVQTILGKKNPNINQIRGIFRSAILQTPGITSIRELNVNYNPGARTLVYDFAAVNNVGAIILGGNNPFIVKTPISGGT